MRFSVEVHPWTTLGHPKRWRVTMNGKQHSVHETEAEATAAAADLRQRATWSWRDGVVDAAGDYLELRYGSQDADPEEWVGAARVGPPSGNVFPVEWLVDPKASGNEEIVKAIVHALDFYLKEVGGADPWTYAQYHCGTTSNWYGDVHWVNYVRRDPVT